MKISDETVFRCGAATPDWPMGRYYDYQTTRLIAFVVSRDLRGAGKCMGAVFENMARIGRLCPVIDVRSQ